MPLLAGVGKGVVSANIRELTKAGGRSRRKLAGFELARERDRLAMRYMDEGMENQAAYVRVFEEEAAGVEWKGDDVRDSRETRRTGSAVVR